MHHPRVGEVRGRVVYRVRACRCSKESHTLYHDLPRGLLSRRPLPMFSIGDLELEELDSSFCSEEFEEGG